MPFPAYGTSVPTLSTWQFSFLGYTFGPGQPLEIQKIEGLDLSNLRTGDAGRPRDRGRFIGLDLLDGRDITITGQLLTTSSTAWTSLAQVLVAGGTVESPLFFNLPNIGTVAVMARVRKHTMPLDIEFALGNLGNIVIMFSAVDPCIYAQPTLQPSVSPPSLSSGFTFPLSFNISFGGGSVAGALSINNTGNIETRPILTVTGPCTNPSITNASITGSPNLSFALSMNTGDTLVIDTDFHTATYFTSGSTIGSTRIQKLVQGSQWWTLQPGVNSIQFLTGDSVATGTLAVAYAPAYIL